MYLHSKNYEIKYTDVDFRDRVKPSALLSFMQESACLSADELGFGYRHLQPKNIGFILANWYVEMYRTLSYGDIVTVKTWPVKPKKLIVFRDFEVYVGEEKVGVGTSRWCLVDLSKFSMLPSSAIFDDLDLEFNDFRSTPFNSWKIPEIGSGEVVFEKYVAYSDCDHYNHANNTKYADMLFDAFTLEELRDKRLSTMQISYIKQCKCGEKLEFIKRREDDGVWIVEGRVDGELRVQFKVGLQNV